MATTPTTDVNIGSNASDLSSTASMSASSIPSTMSDISADSENNNPPSTAFRSAMELSSPEVNITQLSESGQNGASQSADANSPGGNSPPSQQQSMSGEIDSPQNSIRLMLLEFSTKIETSQNTLAQSLKEEMRDMKEVLTPIKASIDEAHRKIECIENEHMAKIVSNTNQIVDTNAKLCNAEIHIQQLQKQLHSQKPSTSNYAINPALIARLNNIVISGIKEDRDEVLDTKIEELAADLNCEISNFKARRLGKVKANTSGDSQSSSPKPRQILVELTSNWEKRKLYAARSKLKDHDKTALHDVYFNEDLDKSSSELYYKARLAKRQHKIKSVWTFGCQVYFSKLGSEQPILLSNTAQLPALNPGNDSQITTPDSGSLRPTPSNVSPPGIMGNSDEANSSAARS